MIRNISTGIDLGSSKIRVVVGEFLKDEKNPKILGVGEAVAEGTRHGYIVDKELALASLKKALAIAERNAEIKIKRAFIGLSGVTLRGESGSGNAIVSKADGEVTTLDINKALDECEENLRLINRKVIHLFPLSFRLDGKDVLGRPEGMRGTKLEARALFVTYSSQHLEDLLEVISEAGVEGIDVIAAPIAANRITLSQKQKVVGVALVDIGAETTSLSVFENGTLAYLNSFKIGGADITNDIALGLKIPLEVAERLKTGGTEENFSRRKLEEIIGARLSDIFELIDNNLKKIKRSELLPAGIVFVGGGAFTPGLVELSKSSLKLPSDIGVVEIFGNAKTKLRDTAWFTAVGLLMGDPSSLKSNSSLQSIFKNIKYLLKSGIEQLLP